MLYSQIAVEHNNKKSYTKNDIKIVGLSKKE